MKLIYGINDKPKFGQTLVFAFQQMIAIMAATLLVPMLMSGNTIPLSAETLLALGLQGINPETASATIFFDPAAALLGAGAGTLIYLLFTKRRSPVFLGSSFTFLGAYAAVIGANYGYWGVLIGVAFAGLVYVVIALIIKLIGSGWINKIMPPVIIGPIVTLIGLSLSGTATGWMSSNGGGSYSLLWILVGALTFLVIAWTSVKGTKMMKLIPFIIGIGFGYVLSLCFTGIGYVIENSAANAAADKAGKLLALANEFKIVSFQPFIDTFGNFSITSIVDYPKFTILNAFLQDGANVMVNGEVVATQAFLPINGQAIANIALTFVPIGIVELAQHMADHKNLSNIIEKDLITDPGMHNTLLGDGVGSIVGSIFGGAANTTYGESIGCVAITKNASIVSIFWAAIGCIVLSFFSPFVAVINSIPKCVMGGACIAMYGFIAVSGLNMLKLVDLNDNKNLYIVAAILVTGIGGLVLNFGTNKLTGGAILSLSSLATALIVGLITKVIVNNVPGFKSEPEAEENTTAEE